MGASAGGGKGGYQGRSSRRRRSAGVMSEINVTPLVDVMLVLLIVFMVAAPMMTVGVPVQLPKTQAKQLDVNKDPLYVTVKPDKTIYIQKTEVKLPELITKLQAIAKGGTEEQIFVRADKSVDYGAVMEVMGALNSAGYKKIGLVTGSLDDGAPVTPNAAQPATANPAASPTISTASPYASLPPVPTPGATTP